MPEHEINVNELESELKKGKKTWQVFEHAEQVLRILRESPGEIGRLEAIKRGVEGGIQEARAELERLTTEIVAATDSHREEMERLGHSLVVASKEHDTRKAMLATETKAVDLAKAKVHSDHGHLIERLRHEATRETEQLKSGHAEIIAQMNAERNGLQANIDRLNGVLQDLVKDISHIGSPKT